MIGKAAAMPDTDAPTLPDRFGLERLDALAEAVLLRVDKQLGERIESLSAPAEQGWLRVSDVALRAGSSERTVYRALRSGARRGAARRALAHPARGGRGVASGSPRRSTTPPSRPPAVPAAGSPHPTEEGEKSRLRR